MRLLITGGAGFIGSHIADRALQCGIEVAIVDNLSTGKIENLPVGATFYHIDIRNADDLRGAFEDFKPDVVNHQAAQASVSASMRDPASDASANVMGTLNVLEAARAAGARRIIFASTGGAIYGEIPNGRRAQETHPVHPQSPYAISKFACEHYLRVFSYHHNIEHFILRYANVYGERQNPHGEAGVIAIMTAELTAGRGVQINAMHHRGDAGCIRDYVHVSDVASANLAAVRGTLNHTVINVASGVATSTLDVAHHLLQLTGRESSAITYQGPRAGDLKRSVLNPTLFIRYFGRPRRLSQGLTDTYAWFLDRSNGTQVAVAPTV